MSKWISVKDRLPDEYGEYYVSRACRPRGYVIKFAPIGWVCDDRYPVTHWQPIPQPPKQESK